MGNVYNVGSLFAGVGGVCLGFQNAKHNEDRYNLVWANEMDDYACATYSHNFKHSLIQGDIKKILDTTIIDNEINNLVNSINQEIEKYKSNATCVNKEQLKNYKNIVEIIDENFRILKNSSNAVEIPNEYKLIESSVKQLKNLLKEKEEYSKKYKEILKEKIDVLLGGFPCQAFSVAGSRKGFEDERGNLFFSIINLIEELDRIHGKPRVLFLENVKNLKNHDRGNTYTRIVEELKKVGYIVKEHVINTMDFSELPQNRERIYIVAFLNEKDASNFKMFDNIDEFKFVKDLQERQREIQTILDYESDKNTLGKFYYTKEKFPKYFQTEAEFEDIPQEVRKAERVNIEEEVTEMYTFYQIRRGMYIRKNKSGVCPTLTADMGMGGHNVPLIRVRDGIRKITPQEAFKLQGFPIGRGYELPEKYKDKPYAVSHLYKQAGNSVSVPVIQLIAEEILKTLEEN